MIRNKNSGENTQKQKEVSHRTTSQWHVASTWSRSITFTLWQASHEVSRRYVQKKEKEVTFRYLGGFLAVDVELCISCYGISQAFIIWRETGQVHVRKLC